MKAVLADMDNMSREEVSATGPDGEPVRRRGDRRVQDQQVPDDRRKGDRRDIPGFSALIRTLFRRGTSKKT
jgi:hypothetical protein